MSKAYQYKYDIDGFYAGLCYKNDLGVFDSSSTDIEPEWRDGFRPLWQGKRWVNVRRDYVAYVHGESEVSRRVGAKVDHVQTCVLGVSDQVIDLECDVSELGEIVRKLSREHELILKSRIHVLESKLNMISDSLSIVLEIQKNCDHNVKSILLKKPFLSTILSKIKNLF